MNGNDGVGVAASDRRRRSWPVNALLALGAWKGRLASTGREHRWRVEAPDGRR